MKLTKRVMIIPVASLLLLSVSLLSAFLPGETLAVGKKSPLLR